MKSTFARNAIVLGVMCAVGPFAIDMYLPALPTIAAEWLIFFCFVQGIGAAAVMVAWLKDPDGNMLCVVGG